jgi:hypothetical protein
MEDKYISFIEFIHNFFNLTFDKNETITSKDDQEQFYINLFYNWLNSESHKKSIMEYFYKKPFISNEHKTKISSYLSSLGIINEKNKSKEYINIFYDKIYTAIYILNNFKLYNFLKEKENKMYLLNSKEYTWINIKNLSFKDYDHSLIDNNDFLNILHNEINIHINETYNKQNKTDYKIGKILIYKILLWYFRKIFVYCIIDDIILYYAKFYKSDCRIKYNSVGSTYITSDFDITLNYDNEDTKTYLCKKRISIIIYKFNQIIQNILKETPDIVFDTNLYGSSFMKEHPDQDYNIIHSKNISITDVKNDNCSDITCNSVFNYNLIQGLKKKTTTLREAEYTVQKKNIITKFYKTDIKLKNDIKVNDINDQHVWAIIKLFANLKKISEKNNIETCNLFEENKSFYDWIVQKITKEHKKNIKLFNMIIKAVQFIESHKNDDNQYILSLYDSDKMIQNFGINNSLSFTNYFGNETYYTRGAFIDIVVNQQMLKNNNIIKLKSSDYLDSLIENLSDYLYHDFNIKYLKRADSALQNISKVEEFIPNTIQYSMLSNIPINIKVNTFCAKIINTVDFIFDIIQIVI